MRRLILSGVLVASCLGVGGCFNLDVKHDLHMWNVIKSDLVVLHEDIDFILGLQDPNPNESYFR